MRIFGKQNSSENPSAGMQKNDGTPARSANRAGSPEGQEPVSIWLYLAGLCVTLSGLYAVHFGHEEQGFAWMTYVLTIGGYAISYTLRRLKVSLQTIQVPLMVCLGLIFFAGMSSEQGLSWFVPAGILEDRAKSLQLVFVYMAVVHSFLLTSDAAVLFSCVPCMTMLALVSTLSSEQQIQNAFYMFIAASTFMMVHENYLRTRASMASSRAGVGERRLFQGQLQLAALCVGGALILANFVAVPIRAVGQSLFLPTGISPQTIQPQRTITSAGSAVRVNEREALDLTGGPVSESNVPILQVRSDRGLYWRGTTFDFYTGRRFENRQRQAQRIAPVEVNDRPSGGLGRAGALLYSSALKSFRIPKSPVELAPEAMQKAQKCVQTVTVVGGNVTQIYGAANVLEVRTALSGLQTCPSGDIYSEERIPINSAYEVTSWVADDDPEHLRAAPTDPAAMPDLILETYLQTHLASETENERLRTLAEELTRDKSNNYDKVMALKGYIERTAKYNLQAAAPPQGRDVVEYFLLEGKQGYCDKFAAALTILCRYAGIPARIASGFRTGSIDEKTGAYLVLEKDKHAWTEVFFPKIGWVTFDATEGAEDITDRSAKTQRRVPGFLTWFFSNGILPPLVALVVFALAVYLIKTELWDRFRPRGRTMATALQRPATNVEIVNSYLKAGTILAKRGLGRPLSLTPAEYLEYARDRMGGHLPDVITALDRLTELHIRYRYGLEVATEDDVRIAQEALATLQLSLAQAGGKGRFESGLKASA